MLLASFVSGLMGMPGKQVRYATPATLSDAVKFALTVEQAESQEKKNCVETEDNKVVSQGGVQQKRHICGNCTRAKAQRSISSMSRNAQPRRKDRKKWSGSPPKNTDSRGKRNAAQIILDGATPTLWKSKAAYEGS
jgi:hypothetical protein